MSFVAGAAAQADPAPEPIALYRQVFANPADIVAAAFSESSATAEAVAPSTRLAKYFVVSGRSVSKNSLYLEMKPAIASLDAILPAQARVKVWVKGVRANPEGPWHLEAEGPLGQRLTGIGRLERNSGGAMAVIKIESTSLGAQFSRALAGALLRSGLVFPSAREAREASLK